MVATIRSTKAKRQTKKSFDDELRDLVGSKFDENPQFYRDLAKGYQRNAKRDLKLVREWDGQYTQS
ncbi:MAG: hypothetical protein ABIA93_05395 [Candidatus Woesearchaeota archaeon]